LGHLSLRSDGTCTLLATFPYDANRVPTSVLVGSNPCTATHYYYVYNGYGNVVAPIDANGNVAATYSCDAYGVPSSSENFANGWSSLYRYDGQDGVRYDPETGLYWMSTRAYDPTLGRFLTRDPLGRALLFFADQPYAYAGNNALDNVDPRGHQHPALHRLPPIRGLLALWWPCSRVECAGAP
jgi:RHS repeat-associated protein